MSQARKDFSVFHSAGRPTLPFVLDTVIIFYR